MTPVAAWFRLEVRLRWRSLLVLALLIALAGGTVMAAVAGARRGASAVDRLQEPTLPATAMVVPNQPGFDWDAVRALRDVEALATFVLTDAYVIEELPRDFLGAGFPFADDEGMRTIERPVVLEGRLPDAARADEIAVSPLFRDSSGRGVGDSLTLHLYAPETLDAAAAGGELPPDADGPVIEARIVGVVRSPLFRDEVGDTEGLLVTSPGLFAQYTPNFVGASGETILNALVRLRGGEDAMAGFKAELERVSGRTDIDVWNLAEWARRDREVTGFEANALLLFALAVGAAAVFLVGQSIVRYSTAAVADLQTMRAVGMTPRQSRWAAAASPTAAAAVGSVLGVAGAMVASRWFPIGTAALFEPAPGIHLDAPVLGLGGVAAVVLVAAAAAGAASLALRSAASRRVPQRSAVAVAAARAAAPVPVAVGARFALEPGTGAHAVPVRPALLGASLGVLGVVAAITFSAGVEDAAAHPARFGQVHQLEVFAGFDGEALVPAEEILPLLAADPEVVAVNDARLAVGEVDRISVTLFTLDPVDSPWRPIIVSGRVPEAPHEVTLAPGSAAAMGVTVGDTVSMTGTASVRELTVTGLAFVPEAPHNDYVTGGWVTAAGFDELFDPVSEISPAFKFRILYLALQPGAEPGSVAARLEAAAGVQGLLYHAEPPSPLAELQQVRRMPLFLAAFLALLALGAVGHALATSVRRRRHDVAVLRAVGMTRRQVRWVVVTQATVLAVVGLVVGVPLGVAVGRTVWRYVADTTPLFYVPPLAAAAVLLVVPVAVAAANLLAAWPGHRAASQRVGYLLRAE